MSIYIPSNNSNYVTQTQLGSYATLSALNNGLSTKLSTSGNVSVQAGTGSFTNLYANQMTGASISCNNLTVNNKSIGKYLLLNDNSTTQTVANGTQTPIAFGTTVTNTFSNLSLTSGYTGAYTGAYCSQITYTGTGTAYFNASYSCGSQNVSSGTGAVYNTFFRINGGSARYGQMLVPTYSSNQCVLSSSALVPMNTNDYLELIVYQRNSNAPTTSTVSTVSFPSVLSITS